MTADIVENLTKAGFKAQGLPATDVRPSEGVWVHGVFTELNEGNRLQRAPEKTIKKIAADISEDIIAHLKQLE